MKKRLPDNIEQGRVTTGRFASPLESGPDGAFFVLAPSGKCLKVISSSGPEWEHVSVSLPDRCPTWEEMDWIKRMFWRPDETAMQLHVPESQHVNIHEHCLHLWRPAKQPIPLPPQQYV